MTPDPKPSRPPDRRPAAGDRWPHTDRRTPADLNAEMQAMFNDLGALGNVTSPAPSAARR
jgi:hypothetical protein